MNAIYNFFDAARIHRGKWSHTGVKWNNSLCDKSYNHDGYDSKRNSTLKLRINYETIKWKEEK